MGLQCPSRLSITTTARGKVDGMNVPTTSSPALACLRQVDSDAIDHHDIFNSTSRSRPCRCGRRWFCDDCNRRSANRAFESGQSHLLPLQPNESILAVTFTVPGVPYSDPAFTVGGWLAKGILLLNLWTRWCRLRQKSRTSSLRLIHRGFAGLHMVNRLAVPSIPHLHALLVNNGCEWNDLRSSWAAVSSGYLDIDLARTPNGALRYAVANPLPSALELRFALAQGLQHQNVYRRLGVRVN